MAVNPDVQRRAAEAPLGALTTKVPIAPLVETFPDFDRGDAYATQQLLVARRCTAGATVKGYKVRPHCQGHAGTTRRR